MSRIKAIQIRLAALLLFIVSVLFISSAILYSNFKEVSEHQKWVLHTSEVITDLDLTLSGIKDAESGARGFLLTHKPEFLSTYQTGIHDAKFNLETFREATLDNPPQTTDADKALAALKERFDFLESLINSVQKTNKSPDTNDSRMIRGESTMNLIRGLIERMKNRENELLQTRSVVAQRSHDVFTWILILITCLMTAVIVGSFIQIGRSQKKTLLDAEKKEIEARQKGALSNLGAIVAADATIEEMSHQILQFLTSQLGFLAGKMWLLEDGDLKPVAAVGAEKMTSEKGRDFGLVKLAFDRDDAWSVAKVPENYWQIGSGLGGALPNALTFIPFSFQGKKLGVIELAAFGDAVKELNGTLTSVAETVGIGLNAAQSRSQLQMLLERTQQQSEELQAQQEELRSSNEELEQQARALESQQQSLNIKNRELEMVQKELEHRARELEKSSQYKSDFLAKMSHELRTPLNGLLILSTLLTENKEKNLTEQQRQFARSINSAGNDLLVLINDILDLSKIEARKLSLRSETFTLEDLFRSKRRTFEPQTNEKNLTFHVEIPAGLEKFELHTDRQRLEQILRNFLSNAIKFTEEGSVSLFAQVNEAAHTVRFSVGDTGIGIPREKRGSIFEAFEQADSSISRKYGGTGLGLTISRELAALLGGQISLESELGKGSTFSVEIPIRLPANPESRPSTTNGNGNGGPHTPIVVESSLASKAERSNHTKSAVEKALLGLPTDKKTILVVEDDANFRASIVEAVRSYGFHAIEADDGEIALAILNTQAPDAILLDIKLPGISGLGILEMAKQMPHLRHVPVHMISALEYQTNALRMGALGYLTKPVTIEKVRSALDRIENIVSRQVRRVLIIEDDDRQNQAIAQLISGNDLEVVSAKDGSSAVSEIKKKGFDCIILDLTLPDVSGFDLLKELRDLEISLPPIVIYTGRDLSDEEERYLRRYSESIVIKGARSPERLLDEVNLFLHRIESLLPEEKREMLSELRSQEKTFEGKTVLIVDDDIRNIFALMSALEARGLQVRVARDGVEALESLEQHEEIDLVLMDIMMPRMDGFEAIKRIRESAEARLSALPIVALTAKAMREDHEKCMEAGASDYLPKPVNLENLTTVLKVWLAPNGFL
jgi:CheY-like chemotaxis protein/signal transduction histidine kinase/CHASE3 domain sensor protein